MPAKIVSTPVMFELSRGTEYLGYVEKSHKGAKPWCAQPHMENESLGMHATRRQAEAALRAWVKAQDETPGAGLGIRDIDWGGE